MSASKLKRIQELIGFIYLDCADNNCRLIIDDTMSLEDGSSGCFSFEEDLQIEVAGRSVDSWEILAHEYCHFQQWKEGKFFTGPEWKPCNYKHPWKIQEERLEGKYVDQDELEAAYRIIVACEDDCQKRTLKLLDEFKLMQNKKERVDYIKRCNLYLYLIEVEKDLGKIEHEEKCWYSYSLFKKIPDYFAFDPQNPNSWKVPEEVKSFIVEGK